MSVIVVFLRPLGLRLGQTLFLLSFSQPFSSLFLAPLHGREPTLQSTAGLMALDDLRSHVGLAQPGGRGKNEAFSREGGLHLE